MCHSLINAFITIKLFYLHAISIAAKRHVKISKLFMLCHLKFILHYERRFSEAQPFFHLS